MQRQKEHVLNLNNSVASLESVLDEVVSCWSSQSLFFQSALCSCVLRSMAWETQSVQATVAVLEAASVLRLRGYFLGRVVLWCPGRFLTGKEVTGSTLAGKHDLLLHTEALIFE